MSLRQIRDFIKFDKEGSSRLKDAMKKLGLSAHAYDRILRVSYTIADLEASGNVQSNHLSEAIQ